MALRIQKRREIECPECGLVDIRKVGYSIEYGGNVMICECGAVIKEGLRKKTGDYEYEIASRHYTKKETKQNERRKEI